MYGFFPSLPKKPEDESNIDQWKLFCVDCCKLCHSLKDIKDMRSLEDLFELMRSIYRDIDNDIYVEVIDYLTIHCQFLPLASKILQLLNDSTNGSILSNRTSYLPSYLLLRIHLNFTDSSQVYVNEFVTCRENIEILTYWCTHQPYLDTVNDNQNVMLLLQSCVSIIHNVVRNASLAHHFNLVSIKKALVILIQVANDDLLKTVATFSLAYLLLLNEDETNLLEKTTNCIPIIVEILQNCLEDDNEYRHCHGLDVEEILAALCALTVNDFVNQSLIENGGVEVLKECCNVQYPQEMSCATKIIWNLLLNGNHRKILLGKKHDVKNYLLSLKTLVDEHDGDLPGSIVGNIEGALSIL